MRYKLPLLIPILLTVIVQIVSATSYVEQANSLMVHNALNLLIPLGIENFVSASDAIMYYNYIAVGLIMLVAAFAGQTNESRFTFFVPMFAALMAFIGWLQTPDPTGYWGMTVGCCLLGAFMYINDMNHEKYGLPGPGSKVITIAVMIMVFEASTVLMASNSLGLWSEGNTNAGQQQADMTCKGYGYSCDSNGNVDLKASVTTLNNIGGAGLDVAGFAGWLVSAAVGAFKFMVVILGAVVVFSVVLAAEYPFLAASPQAGLFLGIMQLVIWTIYAFAIYNWLFKPSFETAQV